MFENIYGEEIYLYKRKKSLGISDKTRESSENVENCSIINSKENERLRRKGNLLLGCCTWSTVFTHRCSVTSGYESHLSSPH